MLVAWTLTLASFPIAATLMFHFGFDIFGVIVPLITTITGVGMLLGMSVYRSRRFHIRATLQSLDIERRGYWSDFDFNVDRSQLLDVTPVDTTDRYNGKAMMALRIVCDGQPDFQMMYGRDEMEIAYVAALILQRMKVKPVE